MTPTRAQLSKYVQIAERTTHNYVLLKNIHLFARFGGKYAICSDFIETLTFHSTKVKTLY